MSELRLADAVAGAGRCSTCLGPDDEFPADLTVLALVDLQVLHSRIACQLEHEYLGDPDGPHPVTRDRCGELVAELGSRTGPAR